MNDPLATAITNAFLSAKTEKERNWLFLQYTRQGGRAAELAMRMIKPGRSSADAPVNKQAGVPMSK